MVKRMGLIILAPFVAVVATVAALVGTIILAFSKQEDVKLFDPGEWYAPGSWK